jgi:NitT/TauT family transport system substrate-binding protein
MISRARVLRTLGAGALIVGGGTGVRAQSLPVIKVASGMIEPNAQVFYAIDMGFFKKNGLDIDLTLVRSGGVAMEAIVAGQIAAGSGNTVSLGSAILRNIPFVVLAPGQICDAKAPTAAIVVAPNSPIRTLKDLAGKTLGVVSLRNIGELAFDAYFDQVGVDRAGVKFVELAPPEAAEAVFGGRVAAATINEPELGIAVAAGKVRRLASAYDAVSKLFYLTVWFSTRDWLDKNKDLAKRFADGIVQGGGWAESNREQSLAILFKYTKMKEEKSIMRFGRKLDPTLLQPLFDAAYNYKLYGAPLRAADVCWDGK